MQPLTRQELQNAVQQLRDSILGQVATKGDVGNAINAISQRMTSQGDIQRALDVSRDRFLERLGQPFRQQQATMQQILAQIDQVNKRLMALEGRMSAMHGHLQSVRTDTETVAHRTEPVKRTTLSQMFT